MKPIGTKVIAIALLSASLLISPVACGKSDSPDPVKTSQGMFTGTGPALPIDIVDARIARYKALLEKGDVPEQERETAQSLLDDYGKIKTALSGDVSEEYYREITHVLFDSVRMLEEKYLPGFTQAEQTQMQAPPQGAPEGDAGPPDETNAPGPALPPPMVNGMVTGVEELLAQGGLPETARETAQGLLTYYKKLQASLEGEVTEAYYREIAHILFDGMLLMENSFVLKDGASLEMDVLQVETDWMRAFNTMDFELMASLYQHAPDTTSFSPNSGVLYQGWSEISKGMKAYFNSPQGTYTWSLSDEKVTMLSSDVAVIIGAHEVIDSPAEGQQMTGKHVFTRVLKKIDEKWLIVHEHESHLPREK